MEVGFSLQADVMTGGSQVYAMTGRLLKALSDGGVDFYAVASAIHLGQQIPILEAHEIEISRLLKARTGRAGYLAKALHIGWGHSDIAIELARTRAGTSALLTIGALATGSTTFMAAQAFAELLGLSGCPPEKMPNIDVLNTMIRYLAPFMSDLGFRKVFQYVVTASKQRCSQAGQIPLGLEATGEAAEWAKAVRQLVLTAQRQESLHLQAYQRGAWLGAYASHVLDMAVQVLMGEIVLWQSAGSAGSVFIQLSEITTSKMIADREDIFKIGPPTGRGLRPMTIDYEIGKALGAEVAIDGRITPSIASSVERAIVRLSATLCVGLRVRSSMAGYTDRSYKINGNFERFGNLVREQCTILGINAQNLEKGWSASSGRVRAWTGTGTQAHGLRYLDEPEANELRTTCGYHRSIPRSRFRFSYCLCQRVGNLIHGFGATALALVQCVYDPTELRIQAEVVNGSKITEWSSAIIASDRGEPDGVTTSDQLFVHLSQLLHEPSEALEESDINASNRNILGVSIHSTTIYYRALLDAECYDDRGRMLAITSGRISHKGVLRQLVKESGRFFYADVFSVLSQRPVGNFAKLTDRFVITPHYARGNVQAKMQVTLAEDAFWVEYSLNDDEGKLSVDISLALCINNMLLSPVMGRCLHSRDRRYVVDDAQRPTYLATLSARPHSRILGNSHGHQSSAIFYALQNSTLEQLLQIGVLGIDNCIIQGEGCLQCAADSCRGAERPVEIIMT